MKQTNKSHFRLLPIIIFLCAIIFSLKIESLFEKSSSETTKKELSFLALPSAQAQDPSPISDEKPEERAPNISTTPPEISMDAGNLVSAVTSSTEDEKYTESELAILQDLAARRNEIEEKSKELELKIAMLNAAEMQIDKKVLKLKELETSIQTLVDEYDENEKSQLTSLVTIYSNMKPKDAARIFNDLDMEILIKLFSQMKESKAATILSAMDVTKANALTIELANKTRPDFIKKD